MLDEPTNHLDFETVEALGHALRDFAGTVFFTSHDRTFVNLIATTILDVKNGQIRRYPGTYEEYVDFLEVQARQDFSEGGVLPVVKKNSSKAALTNRSNSSAASRGEPAKSKKTEQERLRKQMNKLQGRIKHHTEERNRLTQEVGANPFNYSRQRNERIKQAATLIEEAEKEWCQLQQELDRLQT